ncbi:cobaltochelatase subunit CobN [Amphritea sp.]|uniref:cobaltochelatase subunit CobN n=1 Tax=Amphritea sp. TaxID=1872502 RepID=UPI003A8FBC85
MNVRFQFLWLLVFMLLPLQSVFAVVKSDVAIITTPFVLPAKITMLQAIAKEQGVNLEGHVLTSKDEAPEAWFDRSDLVVLDTPRGGDRARVMELIKETLDNTDTPWIVVGGGPPDGGNLDPTMIRRLVSYYSAGGRENFTHLMAFISAWQKGEQTDTIPSPVMLASSGYYHPAAQKTFRDLQDYMDWGDSRWQKAAPVLAVAISSSNISDGQTAVLDHVIARVEEAGAIPLVFWFDRHQPTALADQIAAANPVMLVNTTHMVSETRQHELPVMNIPVVMGLTYRNGSIQQWRETVQGMPGAAYAALMVIPESWGMTDPLVIAAIEEGAPAAIPEQVDLLVGRFLAMARLQTAARDELNLGLLFWNSPSGEKNLSASNLNVPRSIENILRTLAAQGYDVSPHNEADIITTAQSMLAAYYRPETLDELLAAGYAESFPVAKYNAWLKRLPPIVSQRLGDVWGPPQDHWSVRSVNGEANFIIPRAKFGKLLLLPQPPRADKLGVSTHDLVQPPGHFYLAVYLYLREQAKTDAFIHLGTHGTQEWTPSKDRGLWAYDYPNLAIANVPVLYPYIQDNIGEAMQAKRRGRATIISHQTPPFAPSGFYDELSDIHALIHQYQQLEKGAVRDATLNDLLTKVIAADLQKDIGWTEEGIRKQADAFMPVLHDHMHLLAKAATPIGLHTFGSSGAEEYRIATVMQQLGTDYYQALNVDSEEVFASSFEALFDTKPYTYLQSFIRGEKQPEDADNEQLQDLMATAITYNRQLRNNNELEALLAGLRGEFILPGPGGDPVRNPDTTSGTNLYALDPNKIPSPAAYQAAKKTFNALIEDYQQHHDGEWPEKLAFSLWSSEAISTLGLSEAQVMVALGVRPVWNAGGKIESLEVIPQTELGRPRVDVLLQVTSVYRDQFDGIMKKLAQAIETLAELDEAHNTIANNSHRVAASLQQSGLSAAESARYSQVRIFSNPPGDYGSGVTSVAMDSTGWEDDKILADTFINSQSHIYGVQDWGTSVLHLKLLESQLQGVDAVLLSRSSSLHGLLSTDHPFEYLGGLSAAVKQVGGENPALYISDARGTSSTIASAQSFLSNELRTRYQNPQWIKGMQREGYAGSVHMLKIVNNLFGWQVMDRHMVRPDQWQAMHETYVLDQRDLKLNEWFAEHNPTAQAQLIERMVEAIRKGYWDASDQTRQELISRWQALVNDLGAQSGAEKTVEYIESQAAGFGMSGPAPEIDQSANSDSSAMRNVRGQLLEEVTAEDQNQPLPWLTWVAWLLLLSCVIAGGLFPLYRRSYRHGL